MRSNIFSTAINLRYTKRRFSVFTTVSALCPSQVITLQRLAGVLVTSLGFGRAVESILSRVNVEGQFFCYRYI